MSGLLMGRAFYFKLQPRQKLLLLAIADHANDDGYGSHPSQARLAEKVGCTRRHIQNLLHELESMDLVTVIDPGNGAGMTSRYHLPWAEEQRVGKGGNIRQKGELQTSHEPSLDPSPTENNFSEEKSSSSGAREDDDFLSSLQDLYTDLPHGLRSPITAPAKFFAAVRENGNTIPGFDVGRARGVAAWIQHAFRPLCLQFPHPKEAAGLADLVGVIATHSKMVNASGNIHFGHLKACVGEFLATDGDEEGGELNPDTVLTRLARQPDKLRRVIDLSG
jgi:hypothetical protein